MPQYLGGLIPVNEKHLSHCYKASLIIHFVLFSSELWFYSFRADLIIINLDTLSYGKYLWVSLYKVPHFVEHV